MFKVMSLNCNYLSEKHGPWNERLKLITDLIARTDPDVVVFQAVALDPLKTEAVDQGSQIANRLNYRYSIFKPADCTTDRNLLGQTIIAKHPVTEVEVLELSRIDGINDQTRRLVLKGKIHLQEGAIYIYNAHYSWITAQTRQNIEESLPFIEKNRGMGLLIGDLNHPPGEVFDILRDHGWNDAWMFLKKEKSGSTFESDDPKIRIDYAWVNKDLHKYLSDINTYNHQSSDQVTRISDHLALMAVFTLNVPN